MYDIVFHYKEDLSKDRLEVLKNKFPAAHFIKVGEEFNFLIYAKRFIKKIKSEMFWFLPASIGIGDDILNFKVPEWDKQYVHHQLLGYENLFLIPTNHEYTDEQFEKNFFNNVKFVDFKFFSRYDVYFLSFNEKSANDNFSKLQEKCPYAKRITNVEGIFKAHYFAALDSTTDFLWVVDADAEIIETFNFDYEVPAWDFDVIHIWPSQNKINGLVYGNGGVKLIPRHLIIDADPNSVDITTSLGANIKIMEEISNYNNFATGPFSAWRGAFRECAKLASSVIDRQVQEETDLRLEVWQIAGKDTEFGKYVNAGAIAGKEYGTKHKDDRAALKRINDWNWLREQFNFVQQTLDQVEK